MNERKGYASPAVLTEDLLEQTSLACNSTVPLSNNDPNNFAPGAGDPDCTIDVSKNNAFHDVAACPIYLTDKSQVVALS